MANDILAGKVAIVTGASGGLGVAIAHAFLVEGAKVLAVHRNPERLTVGKALMHDIGTCDSSDFLVHCVQDLTASEAAEVITEEALRAFGRVDVLVNNAAVFTWKPFLELTHDDWQASVNTNMTAPFRLTQAVAQQMIRQGQGGSVVNIASIHSLVPDGHLVAQCASKYGLVGLTQASAEALREAGVRVNAICPGEIEPDSPTKQSLMPNARVTQADVAQIAVYLASHRSHPVTGSSIEAFGASRPVIPLFSPGE